MSLNKRVKRLEARRGVEPERRVCELCGTENGGSIITEVHHEDGMISFSPRAPCPGCAKLLPPGRVRCITIHTHGCWCRDDESRLHAARERAVDPTMPEYKKYASGAEKYQWQLEERKRQEFEASGGVNRQKPREALEARIPPNLPP